MSLGRLLAAGKSLMGSSGGSGRYQVSKQTLFPKFISPKNPFAPVETAAKPCAADGLPEPVAEPKPLVTGAEAKATGKLFSLRARIARSAGGLGAWGRKVNPFSRRLQKTAPIKPAALQGELSLDAVKVVRNDLSDADYEIAQLATKNSVSPVRSLTAGKLHPVGEAWERLTTKFLGDEP